MSVTKLLVANRGEIATRAFRAANELGIATVAVYAWEDRNSSHRQKADEAYQIGEQGHPVRSYLDVGAVVQVALDCGADAVYPGYGFLSENPELARACTGAGLTFIGPPADVLSLTGNKVRAVREARAAGLPTLAQSAPFTTAAEAASQADAVGFPLFVKAAAGGGGRGMRRVQSPGDLVASAEEAMREAEAAFGDPTAYLEEAVERPRHIEVQLLGDATGEVVHLFERDCSVQRRHQKVLEVAPAPGLDPALRDRICADAVRYGRHLGYVNAGTVEFLLRSDGQHRFIEMNPRIQVEHTVTEETTDVDLVVAQLRIARGETLAGMGLEQDRVVQRGVALQCRVTTEDAGNGFRPDTGRLSVYRQPGGAGIRLDGGDAYVGAEVSGYFDPLLVKLTCRGRDLPSAIARARRALAEFRIRGVVTNIAFLRAVLAEPGFAAGRLDTGFIEDRPHLLRATGGADRASRLLGYLADVTVNQPNGAAPTDLEPSAKLPLLPDGGPPAGSRQRLQALGPAPWAAELRGQRALAVCDTTFRDAHQSLLATRVRTADLVAVAPHVARLLPGLLSLECWGGATYDVALRFLHEDPWDRLARLREAVPNLCLQMLLRGRNTVGYTPYPDAVCRGFVAEAAAQGMDVFRIFDALNDPRQMRPAIDAVLEAGAVAEGALCYTGDLLDPAEAVYTLDHYLHVAEELVRAGVHVLTVKDMAGLLKAPAARHLVAALRERFDVPVRLHTHDTAGGQLATYLAAAEVGVDAVDGAIGPLSGMTSQPPLGAIVAACQHTERDTGLSLHALGDLEPYWEATRTLYAPWEAGLAAPTGAVYRHEIPGGQLSNLRQQAIALGLGHRFEDVAASYIEADRLLGHIIKVTPTSKVVGDLALYLASTGVGAAELARDPASHDLPESVLGFLRGDLGTPPGGWPEPFRARALAGRAAPPEATELDGSDEAALVEPGEARQQVLNRLLFPAPTAERDEHVAAHGDLSVLPTRLFFYGLGHDREEAIDVGPGVRVLMALQAIGEPDDRGVRTVIATVNGQVRPVDVRDQAVEADVVPAEQADPADPAQVAAPYNGVVTLRVGEGDTVETGQVLATIEAMKIESSITSPRAGTVERVAVGDTSPLTAGDLILVIKSG
ncbi:MAG: pyruvate carboxylase [Acidimicrobiia bacterium]|nr:pyruvate carboxylase [Acidimicrobiia bacterium]